MRRWHRPDWLTERRGLLLMLAPFVVGLVGLVLLPFALTVAMAFTDYDLVRSPRWVGLDNFASLPRDPVFRAALVNSLTFAAVAVPLRLLIAFGLALLLHRRAVGAASARTAAALPIAVPEIAYGLLFLWLFNPLYGPINQLLSIGGTGGLTIFGRTPPQWLTDPQDAQAGIVIMSLFVIGEMFVILLALRDTVLSFQYTFVPTLVVTEGGPPPYGTTHLSLFIYRNAFEYLRYGYAAAATFVMLALTVAAVAVQWRLIRRYRRTYLDT
jgi:multiple sugar transport system permease protein